MSGRNGSDSAVFCGASGVLFVLSQLPTRGHRKKGSEVVAASVTAAAVNAVVVATAIVQWTFCGGRACTWLWAQKVTTVFCFSAGVVRAVLVR